MKPGLFIQFAPTALTGEVKSVEQFHEMRAEAMAGDYIGFNVKAIAQKDLRRGYVASNAKDDPAKEVESF